MMAREDDKKRPSWREIDKLKDQSGLAKLRKKIEKKDKTIFAEDPKNKQRYLKELERLFADKQELEKQNFIEKLHKQYGTKNFKKLAKEFIEKYGLPEDWRTLILFLDLEEEEIVLKTLEKLREEFPKRSISEKQGILSKLKTLALTSKDETISYKAESLLKELNL